MGEALLSALISNKLFPRNRITAADKRKQRLNYIRKKYKVNAASTNTMAAEESSIIILAVKPQDIDSVLDEIADKANKKLVISIAAGITIAGLRKKLKTGRLVRAMPNTPALVNSAVTVICPSLKTRRQDTKTAKDIFDCVGETIQLQERYIDAVTAVSGSGPAYFFLLMEAMLDAAQSLGLKKDVAFNLIRQTAFGACALQKASDCEPSALRERVTSRGGTTAAALKVFKDRKFNNIVKAGLKAAAARSKQLSCK